VAYTGARAVVRLLSVPGFSRQSVNADDLVRGQVGLDTNYRLGYAVATQASRGKQDVSLIAVGVPEEESSWLLQVVRNSGPSPVSMEVSAMSCMTAFVHGPGSAASDQVVGLIEAGEQVTLMAVVKQGVPVLLRKFEFGHEQILERVGRQFSVDHDTAVNILRDRSFDVSQPVSDAMGGMLRQLAISKEFVERKAGAPVQNWYLSGGLALAAYWRAEIEHVVGAGVKVWNPLGNLLMAQDVWPDELVGQEPRFSAAIGLAIGALEDV
jgi:Tfp pilus assembly PilM family ATPase